MSHSYPFHLVRACVAPLEGFRGNSAAVIVVDVLPSVSVMQSIAADLAQPATTFVAIAPEPAQIRWFAPDAQIGLCGHGSLAASTILPKLGLDLSHFDYGADEIHLQQEGTMNSIHLSAIPSEKADIPSGLSDAFGVQILEHHSNDNKHLLVVEDEQTVKRLQPDYEALRRFKTFGWVVTAPGEEVDFVSRTFVPHVSALEDAATGSSHAALTPFWSARLDKEEMRAHQLSERGGRFICRAKAEQVQLLAECEVYGEGVIHF